MYIIFQFYIKCFTCIMDLFFTKTFEVAITILQMSKLRLRKVKQHAPGDTISRRTRITSMWLHMVHD
jgi:uncharacterized membrane protein